MSESLRAVLMRAEIPSHHAGTWFAGCTLTGSVLEVPDRAVGERLVKLFGAQLRAVVPGLTVRVAVVSEKPKPPSYLNAKGRQAWTQGRLTEDP